MRSELRIVPPLAESHARTASAALDDSALLQALRANDPTVAGALYARVRPIVDRTLTRLLGIRDPDYEDLAQLSLLEIVTTAERFRGECPLDA